MLYPIELWVQPESGETYKRAGGFASDYLGGSADGFRDLGVLLKRGGDLLDLAKNTKQIHARDFLQVGG